jgi:iron complex outermembrane receptor protein
MKKIIIILISIVIAFNLSAEDVPASPTSLEGKITDKSGVPVVGASLYFPELKTGTVTNQDGFYTIDNLPKRKMVVQINSVGYKMIMDKIDLASIHQKDYVLEESVTEINEVTVTGQSVTLKFHALHHP